MPAGKKTLTFITYRDIGTFPDRKTVWADVWVEFFKGKRKKQELGPCILGMVDLEAEIKQNQWQQNNIKDYSTKEEVKKLLEIKRAFASGEKFFLDNFNKEMPNIYVNKDYISRNDAAKAIEWWLKKENFISKSVGISYRWKKNKIMHIGAG